MSAHRYNEANRDAIFRVIRERRDMRHFNATPVEAYTLQRLLTAAHHAPSVGYMQPWRFIRITFPLLCQQIHTLVEAERIRTASALSEREDEFKVEGILDCGELLVGALMERCR